MNSDPNLPIALSIIRDECGLASCHVANRAWWREEVTERQFRKDVGLE